MRLFPVTIDINQITDDMIVWAKNQGADVWSDPDEMGNVYKNDQHIVINIRIPNSKTSKVHKSYGGRLHFDNSQKESALLFLLQYNEHIVNHNMTELNSQENVFYDAT